ncbi:MAG TPA: TIGR02996 domain-containing protein [Gemmataceae bacterium]|nr:TIGR02996 domain-containing protein [Gemmataceae bacterium]
MSDEAAILAAIAAQPAEDTPRLAYADWLDEHGDAAARIRAEFIRVQCAIKPLDDLPSADAQQYATLYRRQNEILEGHRRDLLGPLGEELNETDMHRDVTFDRGFVSDLTLEVPRFLRHADAIAAFQPLPVVTVTGLGPWLDALSEQPHHAELIARCRVQSDGHPEPVIFTPNGIWNIFVESWPWSRLVALDLEACLIRDEGLERLAQGVNDNLVSLTELDLSGNEISDDGVRLLVASPLWPRLKRLVLGGNPISDVGAVTLANAAAACSLEYLNLRFTGIGLDGIRALSRVYGGRVDVF